MMSELPFLKIFILKSVPQQLHVRGVAVYTGTRVHAETACIHFSDVLYF